MKPRTSSSLRCSLSTASFRTVLAKDRHGLTYRVRREIMTTAMLRRDPHPAISINFVVGRIRTNRDIFAKHCPKL